MFGEQDRAEGWGNEEACPWRAVVFSSLLPFMRTVFGLIGGTTVRFAKPQRWYAYNHDSQPSEA